LESDAAVKIDTIFLDVDEVLVAWVDGLLRLLGRDPATVHASWDALDPRPWDVVEVLGVSHESVWRAVDEAGASFWSELDTMSWCDDLFAACSNIAPTYLLTSPSLHPSSLAGKLAWIQRQFGRTFRDYLIGPCKSACARPGALLIDDHPKNCAGFVRAGGSALLFPGVGNSLHSLRHDPLPTLWTAYEDLVSHP
jgi:5'(3')-deoxyribonucleotidase